MPLYRCRCRWKPREVVEPAQVRLAMSAWDRDSFIPTIGMEVEVMTGDDQSVILIQ